MKERNVFPKSERGQAIVLITFAIIGLVALVGLTVDGGRTYADRRQAQNAADTAAYAAALQHINDPAHNLSKEILAAKNLALMNGYNSDLVTNTVTVTTSTPPSGACPSDAGSNVDYKVQIQSKVGTTFARVIGIQQMTNNVFATSRACDVGGQNPALQKSAVYTTKTGSCNGASDSSIFVNGSADLQVWGGDIAIASTDPDCINFQGGETQLKKAESGTDCADIVTAATSGGSFDGVSGQDGCGKKQYGQSIDTNFPDLNITCGGNAVKSGSKLSPGNYTGSFPPSGVTSLDPGTYCINGDFKMTGGTLNGSEVTIVMNTGTMSLTGSSKVNISAPTSGTYQGLLIYAPPSNSVNIQSTKNNEVRMEGSESTNFTGTVMAQNLPCWFAGNSEIQKATIQFICYTWGMDGSGQAQIVYDPSLFYAPVADPGIFMIK